MRATRRTPRLASTVSRGVVLALGMAIGPCTSACRGNVVGAERPRTGGSPERLPFHRPPVVDGSRTACLFPPYTPERGTTRLADGTPCVRGEDGRAWTFSLHGAQPFDAAASTAVLTRQRARGGPFQWLSYGLYCGAGHALCFVWEGNLCETNVAQTASLLLDALRSDPDVRDHSTHLIVTLAGRLGPRCTPGATPCEPIAYQGSDRADPDGPRTPGPLPHHGGGRCRHDGDCVVAGCGNHCVSWDVGGAHEGATCEGYAFHEPVFCGCVEEVCQWFGQ